jgi:heptosyltransferase-3
VGDGATLGHARGSAIGSGPTARASSLIYHAGAIGDFVTTLPAFRAWRSLHPRDRIVLLGRPLIAALTEGSGLFDETWDAESSRFAPLFRVDSDLASCPGLEGFASALVFSPPSSPLSANLERLGVRGIVRQDPFPQSSEGGRAVPHVIDYHLSLFQDLPLELRVPSIDVSGSVDAGAGSGKTIALHPGSGSSRKNWPRERFVELARRLASRGSQVAWIIGPAEESFTVREGVVWRGRDLPAIAALLSRSRLFVGNDSGIGHVAAAVGCPVVALFGPTDPAVWSPRGTRVRVLRSGDARMESISVDEVLIACGDFLPM